MPTSMARSICSSVRKSAWPSIIMMDVSVPEMKRFSRDLLLAPQTRHPASQSVSQSVMTRCQQDHSCSCSPRGQESDPDSMRWATTFGYAVAVALLRLSGPLYTLLWGIALLRRSPDSWVLAANRGRFKASSRANACWQL
jgi:hypothetical protein